MCALAPDPIELERIVSLLDIGHLLDRDAPAGRDTRDRQFPGFRFAQCYRATEQNQPNAAHNFCAAFFSLAASVVSSSSSASRSPTLLTRPSFTRCATKAIGPSGTTSPRFGIRWSSSSI